MTSIELFKAGKWTRQLQFPTTWDELTARELEAIAATIHSNATRQALLLQLIAGRARMQGVRLPKGWQSLLDAENAAMEGLPLVDGLLTNNTRTVNPYPMLGSYYGPDSDFKDLSVGEYEDAEAACRMYRQSNDMQHLVLLAAALWRPLDGQRRRMSYKGYVAPVTSFSRRLKPENFGAIYLWFLGCRSRLPLLFPDVFGGAPAAADAEEDLTDFTKLIHSAAGPKNGTREMVRATLLRELLFDCQLAIEEAERTKEEMKATR